MKKKLSDYSHDELLQLSSEEISELFDLEYKKQHYNNLKINKEYLYYSFEAKVKFWAGSLHRCMRILVEEGEDPYSIYTPDWHERTKDFEPHIDKIMDEVFSKYWTFGSSWSKEEYLKRISD